ncbi:MAG: 50S ribosomal protein L18 [bacterium]
MPVGHAEIDRRAQRSRRRGRIRKKVRGTAERPRLAVFRSNKHIYAQLIDDVRGYTLAAASSRELDRKGSTKSVEASKEVGTFLAEKAQEAGIEVVAFDRGGYIYHGRVKALAEGAREGGLKF